ncbi:hypothetical protein CHS0354_038079 [Potamilus streckersoni]|uniref:Uncharacterized protein n=1 Tax=Potamilus streckersoni TaxID=2493646 RepID=A0AAE0W0P9_9BIVA|nr:hypothetical protein CHS0354_038079 [Potamilus streckersoni]
MRTSCDHGTTVVAELIDYEIPIDSHAENWANEHSTQDCEDHKARYAGDSTGSLKMVSANPNRAIANLISQTAKAYIPKTANHTDSKAVTHISP